MPHEDTASAIIDLLDSFKQTGLVAAGLKDIRLIEENTDALTDLFNTASEWPRFSDMPASYRTALQHLVMGRRTHLEKEGAIPRGFASEVFDLVRELPKSNDLLGRMVLDHGVSAVVVTFCIASMLFNARNIAGRNGDEPDDSMNAVSNFVSGLNYGIAVDRWIYMAQALLRSFIKN